MSESQARNGSLLRASVLMASGTMVSRVLGFIKAAMLLAALGSAGGAVSAAFQTANTLPNTIFNLLASGVFDAVLVPQIVRALKRDEGQVYINRLITLAGTILFLVAFVSTLLAPVLIVIMAPGYSQDIRSLAVAFAFLCLPQIFFYGLYNLLGELLNARGVFGPYMWAPVLNNIIAIAGLVAFLILWGAHEDFAISDFTSPQFWLLSITTTLGVVCQALVLFIPMRRAGVSFKPDFHFRGTSFGSASKVAGWTFATLGVSQVGVLSTNAIASIADNYLNQNPMPIAGLAGYSAAFLIFMLPQSVITVSLATAIFTRLNYAVADDNDQEVAEHYHTGIRLITSLTVLAAAIFMAGAAPMMQLVVTNTTRPELISSYALILVSLMPGVASTGIVLMSQRVFFAYEDAKPVFLMGIVPTILQIIVGWSIYFATGVRWWVIGAALGETVCRIVQGLIAMRWVGQRNSYVNSSEITRSYLTYVGCAIIAGGIGFGALWLMGIYTTLSSKILRWLLSGVKFGVVAIIVTVVYMIAMRVINPEESSTSIRPLLKRLHLPIAVCDLLSAAQPTRERQSVHNGVAPSPQEETMATEDQHIPSEGMPHWVPLSVDLSVPSFDDVVHPDGEGHPAASSHSPQQDTPANVPTLPHSNRSSQGSVQMSQAKPEHPIVPTLPATARMYDVDATAPAGIPLGAAAAEASAETAAAKAEHQESSSRIPAPLPHGFAQGAVVGGAAASVAGSGAAATSARSSGHGHSEAGGGSNGGSGGGRGNSGDAQGHDEHSGASASGNGGEKVIDPTRPTIIFAAVLTVVATIWAGATAFSPVKHSDIASSSSKASSSASASASASEQPTQEATQAATEKPVISSVSVLSWQNDKGDHEEMAVNMIDGDAKTNWHSRYFDYNQFLDQTAVTILVKLEKKATVSEITLDMDPSTTGGEGVVRAVNPNTPREGTEIATTTFSPKTDIKLAHPVETEAISITFRKMPTSQDGRAWAWVSELSVK